VIEYFIILNVVIKTKKRNYGCNSDRTTQRNVE